MNKVFGIVPIVMKVLLGLVFIASAILKVVGMDQFEIYIYSYHFFSLNTSFLVARAAIIVELVLGIGLVSNTLHKFYWWGSMLMLLGYSLLLIYVLHLGRTDNCHCFGDVLQFDPKQSLVKNGVLALLFLPLYWMGEWETRYRWLIFGAVVVVSTVAVFLISPPDNYTPSYTAEHNLQVELFDEILDDAPLDSLNLRAGKQVVCFFSTGCEFCQMAAHKLSLMQQYYDFPADRMPAVKTVPAASYTSNGSPAPDGLPVGGTPSPCRTAIYPWRPSTTTKPSPPLTPNGPSCPS